MSTHDTNKKVGTDDSGVPEFDAPPPQNQVETIERDIVNAFTVERDTSLADGAGAPGTTGLGDYEKRNRK
jgi:hypothetical protein